MLYRISSWLYHYLYAVNEHSLHSPLVYDIYTQVVKGPRAPVPFIEKRRSQWASSHEILEVQDYGAGKDRNPNRRISDIVGKAVSDRKKSALIRDLALFFESKSILELGTSLGITTAYLSQVPDAHIITFEGSETIAQKARGFWLEEKINNIQSITGNIDQTLPSYLSTSENLDFIYLDANHRYEPTMMYYEELRRKCHDDTVMIFDDIHYSKEMGKAWEEIRSKVEVTLSLDLFQLGVILFRPMLRKKHYLLM